MRAFTSLMDFSQSSLFFYRSFQFVILHLLTSICRARSEPGGTRWRTGGEVWGKLANGVGSQYSHATSERGISNITKPDAHTSAASSRLNWRPHRFKNGLVRFWERRNLVSVRVPSRSARAIILIAFPLQQWLHERASLLRYTYIECLVWTYAVYRTQTDGKWLSTKELF